MIVCYDCSGCGHRHRVVTPDPNAQGPLPCPQCKKAVRPSVQPEASSLPQEKSS